MRFTSLYKMNFFSFFFFSFFLFPLSLYAQNDDSTSLQIPDQSTNTGITLGDQFEIDYQNPREYTIGSVDVEGAQGYDPSAVRLVAGLRAGQKIVIPGTKISEAVNSLWKEGLFSDVQIVVNREAAGVVFLTIHVSPRPKLSRYQFIGINKRQADKIREKIDLFTGKTISENLVYQTKAKIHGYFREEGYYAVQVDIQRKEDDIMANSELFLINIDRGKRIKIKDIVITGNEALKTQKLRRAMKDTKRKGPLRVFKRSKFTESAYERDKLALLSKFNSVGLRDAKIAHDTVYQISDKHLMIEINIDQGEKYYFGDISWIGNTKFASSFLDTILGIKKGDIYNKELLEQRLRMSQDGRDISSLYMDRGYLFFDVQPVEVDFTDNHISYELRIREGKEARVGKIFIKGNTKTNDHVILREIRTRPGDLFSRNDIIRTQRELAQLGYFNEQAFQVNPIPDPQKGTVDIEYVVEEKSADQIELSAGYGGQYQDGKPLILGTIGLVFSNFSTKKLFSKNAWTPLPAGDGQRLAIRGQTNGPIYQAYNFSFTEPWMGGRKPNSMTVFFSHSAMGSYAKSDNQERVGITGVGMILGRRKKWPDDYFTESYEVGYQYYNVNNSDFFELFKKGFSNDIYLKYTLQRNSVSSPIYPQSGSTTTLSVKTTLPYSLWNGNRDYASMSALERYKYVEYYKIKFSTEWYIPLSIDEKLVLRSRAGFGYMGAYNNKKGISPFERFTMGGSGMTGMNIYSSMSGREIIALRGYDDNSISSLSGDPIGAKYTLELRYPISLNPMATLYVLAFAEAGNTYPNFKNFDPLDVKRSVGGGVRIFLPMFGMIGIDYGFGFDALSPWAKDRGKSSDTDIKKRGFFGMLTYTIGMSTAEL